MHSTLFVVTYCYIRKGMAARFITILTFFFLLLSCKKNSVADPSSDDFIETEPQSLSPVTQNINNAIGGYYLSTPVHYQQSSKKYPLLIFIHGAGQFGDGNKDLPVLLNEAVPELLDEKLFPPDFKVNGKHYSFIILMPQFSRQPLNEEVRSFFSYALKNYRVDPTRVYLSGFSNGGAITCDVAAEFTSLFAAIVPISGVSNSGDMNDKCKRLVEDKMPIWVFHNENDVFVSIDQSKKFIALINGFNPVIPPKFTISPAFGIYGHDAWTKATNPQYRENNMNIYEWMLQYTR
jgi:predicted peptidase